ncbi:aminopeptidase [Camelliibacillus cellulosilyticus]|uniref:Aminopeptidase n=1 Tax=Camelliibacillus cellulosilyticus TaxID=2174486 RepID=A0ABV9GQL1_9BACL
MLTFEQKLENYAELAIKNGVNIQAGQDLVISAPIFAADFVRQLTKKAYQAGAKTVHHRWSDDDLSLIRFLHAPDESFEEFPEWEAKGLEALAKNGAAFLSIYTPNPDLLKDVDPGKIAKANKVAGQALKPYSEYMMADRVSWSLVSVPSEVWAKKLFPELEVADGIAKLWDTIFTMTRADQADPVAAWEAHKANLNEKAAYLNNKKYKKLHYKAPGTDLSIEFHKKHLWNSAAAVRDGVSFIKNIPTEEVYTLPLKTGVNGKVTATMPLNYSGNLIEELSLTFKDGRIVDYSAKSGLETLKHIIETDEGSHYLGEVALVPNDSPISQSGLLFYNTLFDENASCHIAIGEAYPTTLEGGESMSKEELEAHGVNDSLNHVDFMIGSGELDIEGELEDGTREPLMRNGLWVI